MAGSGIQLDLWNTIPNFQHNDSIRRDCDQVLAGLDHPLQEACERRNVPCLADSNSGMSRVQVDATDFT